MDTVELVERVNIPHAAVLGYVYKGRGILNGKCFTGIDDELVSFFSENTFPMAMKPIDGACGKGFDIILSYNIDSKSLLLKMGGAITVSVFLNSYLRDKNGWLFQEIITQHPVLERIYPHAVNTLRAITHLDKNGSYSVVCAMMRIGAGGSITDNNDQGRVISFVKEDGCFGMCFDSIYSQTRFTHHPDTKEQVTGLMLPYYEEGLSLVVRAHNLLPSCRHLAWDVAFTPDGPLIIEVNSHVSIAMNQKGELDLLKTAFGKEYLEIY